MISAYTKVLQTTLQLKTTFSLLMTQYLGHHERLGVSKSLKKWASYTFLCHNMYLAFLPQSFADM